MRSRDQHPSSLAPSQSTSVAKINGDVDTTCDFGAAVRRAVSEEGWGPESLGAHIGVHKSLVSRTLNQDRPSQWAAVIFLLALPVGIQKRLAATWARHLGLIVVEPDTDRAAASQHLLGSIVWILASLSASRSSIEDVVRGLASSFGTGKKRMAKAEVESRSKQEIA